MKKQKTIKDTNLKGQGLRETVRPNFVKFI